MLGERGNIFVPGFHLTSLTYVAYVNVYKQTRRTHLLGQIFDLQYCLYCGCFPFTVLVILYWTSKKIEFLVARSVALGMEMSVCLSGGRCTTLVQTEIYQQLFDGLPYFVQTLMVSRPVFLNLFSVTEPQVNPG